MNSPSLKIVSSLNLLAEFINSGAGRFVSMKYRNAEGELSRYTIMLGVSYHRALESDLRKVLAYTPKNDIEKEAKDAIVTSIGASLTGDNPAYNLKGYFTPIDNRGIASFNDLGEVYIKGFLVKKEVLEPVEYKQVNSKPLTIAKNKIKKNFKSGKVRTFKFDLNQLESVSINNKRFFIGL
jgi:hypothetical protein